MKNISDKLMATLLEYLALGIYQVNDKLPSVRELSTLYHVNPNTIAKVYANLEEKGYIYALPAKGYYVAEVSLKLQENVMQDMKALIHELLILSKIVGMNHADIMNLYKEEEANYDRS